MSILLNPKHREPPQPRGEHTLRKALNLPTYESYKDFVEREDDPEILDVDEEVLGEAANILIDLIELKEKPLLALNEK